MHLELEERTKFAPPARLISRLSYSQQIRSTSILCNQNPRLKFKLSPIHNNTRMTTTFPLDLKLVIITETPAHHNKRQSQVRTPAKTRERRTRCSILASRPSSPGARLPSIPASLPTSPCAFAGLPVVVAAVAAAELAVVLPEAVEFVVVTACNN